LKRPPPRLCDLDAHDLDRLVTAFLLLDVRGSEPGADEAIEKRKWEAAREHDGSATAIRVLGKHSEGSTAVVVKAGHRQRAPQSSSSASRTAGEAGFFSTPLGPS
jgi:hypothetical protein